MTTSIKTTFLNTATPGTGAAVQDFELSPMLTHFLSDGVMPHTEYNVTQLVEPSSTLAGSVKVLPRTYVVAVSRDNNPAPFDGFKVLVQINQDQEIALGVNNEATALVGALVLRVKKVAVQNGATLSNLGLEESTIEFVVGNHETDSLSDADITTALEGDFFVRICNIVRPVGQTGIMAADILAVENGVLFTPSALGIDMQSPQTGNTSESNSALPRINNMPWAKQDDQAVPLGQMQALMAQNSGGDIRILSKQFFGEFQSGYFESFDKQVSFYKNAKTNKYILRIYDAVNKTTQEREINNDFVKLPEGYSRMQSLSWQSVIQQGNYLYVHYKYVHSPILVKIMRYDMTDLSIAPTEITGINNDPVYAYATMLFDGQSFYLSHDGGDSSTAGYKFKRYTLSGTTLTYQDTLDLTSVFTGYFYSNLTCMNTDYIYIYDQTNYLIKRYNRNTAVVDKTWYWHNGVQNPIFASNNRRLFMLGYTPYTFTDTHGGQNLFVSPFSIPDNTVS